VKFWITLIRGGFAIVLGVALIFQTEKALPILANFMGMYWLVSGIVSLRWGVTGERAKGLPLLAGIVGVLAGIGILSRRFTSVYVAEEFVISLVGVIILLTGLLHMFGGFRQGQASGRQWSWTSFLLGIFEVILGLLLIIAPLNRGPLAYFAAMIWALLGGLILIGDALRARRLSDAET
jgi:uncharacterized membrane protein HdeD (DUF308 family)